MNWTKLVNDLLDAGMIQREIETATGLSQGYISTVKRGHTAPSMPYEKGKKLENLWLSRCGKEGV